MSKIRGSFAGLRGRMLSRALVAVSRAMANVERWSDWLLPGRLHPRREGRHVLTSPGRDGHFEAVERHGVQPRAEDPRHDASPENWRMVTSGRQIRPLAMAEGEPAAGDAGARPQVRFECFQRDGRVHARLERAHDFGTQPRIEPRDDHARLPRPPATTMAASTRRTRLRDTMSHCAATADKGADKAQHATADEDADNDADALQIGSRSWHSRSRRNG